MSEAFSDEEVWSDDLEEILMLHNEHMQSHKNS